MKIDANKDLYATLGISPAATQEEIKRAYRSLARRFHPDSGTETASAERFQEVKGAYDVLSSPERRRAYDLRRQEMGLAPQAMLAMRVVASRLALPAIPDEQMLYVVVDIQAASRASSRRLPLNLCLVIDRSTSMDGERLHYVRAAAHQIIDELDEGDVLGIVAFSDRAEVLMTSQRVGDRMRAHSSVSAIWAGGGTEILQGLQAGLGQVRRFRGESLVNHLILLTDGRTYGDEEKCIAEARRAGLERISISAVGIGEDWNDMFLDQLVRQAEGVSLYVAHPQHILDVLRNEVHGLGTLVARSMNLTLRFGEHVWLENAFRTAPYFEQLQPQGGIVHLNSLRGEESVSVLFEIVVAQASLGRQRLLQLELTAEIPGLERRERIVSDLDVEFAVDPPQEPVPAVIINTLGRLSVFRMHENAWAALENGRREEAQKRLETVATRLIDMGESELARAALLEAGRVAQGGLMSEKGHKTLKYGTRGLTVGL